MCWAAWALLQPAENSNSFFFLLVAVKFVTNKGLKLEGKTWGTTSETVCATALKNACFFVHALIPPSWLLPPISLNFCDSSQAISEIILDQTVYLLSPRPTRATSLPPRHGTNTGLPCQKLPISDYQKDAALSPVYYFQFLLEKVNLMSIIGS